MVIAVVGLGYVGLPLAAEFGKQRRVIGYDINEARLGELRNGHDSTRELNATELSEAQHLIFTDDLEVIREASVYIVTVPTPIDEFSQPDLMPLQAATRAIGSVLSAGDIVIFESTVFPGCTEDVCAPILEHVSGLIFNQDFFVGYSPERINPGDMEHRVSSITKITSGSSQDTADAIDQLYASIVTAGTHKASSIRVAEAAKVIENTQRDVNIALINELAMLFAKMGIDTEEVLTAAGTKWNFLPFRAGLVGGHCIGVDPYYLTHKAQSIGYHPEMILSGRRINDGMAKFVAKELVTAMLQRSMPMTCARVLILGFTFKENCPDLRNTGVIRLIRELEKYNLSVDVHDPWASPEAAEQEYGVKLLQQLTKQTYDGIIISVAHDEFTSMGGESIRRLGKPDHIVYDLKHVIPPAFSDLRL